MAMAVAAWVLALAMDPTAPVDREAILTAGLSLGLAVGSILLLPIDRLWVRITLNPLILSLPILATLELFVG